MEKKVTLLLFMILCVSCTNRITNEVSATKPRVIGFYTAQHDPAHISFVHEANRWFDSVAAKHNFIYDSTNDWSRLNDENLKNINLVIFFDTRPEDSLQRVAFEKYMQTGGRWIGFHFAGFALTPSQYPQNWDWYHNTFLGAGEYASNTWRPTSARLRIENSRHPAVNGLDTVISSSPNEWYRWKNDLTKNPAIQILLTIDPSSFPLGTGPKAHEIWHEGYYPVVWTNTNFNMIYFNMGHNDMDYGGTDRALSSSFSSPEQNQLLVNAIRWLIAK